MVPVSSRPPVIYKEGPARRTGWGWVARVAIVILLAAVGIGAGVLITRHGAPAATAPLATSPLATTTTSVSLPSNISSAGQGQQAASDETTVWTGCASIVSLQRQIASGNPAATISTAKGSDLADISLIAGAGSVIPLYATIAREAGSVIPAFDRWEQSGDSSELSATIASVAQQCSVIGYSTAGN